ncbi:MAG: Holliday junction branch migration protein RuvA [Dehalococcoidales bacterium]|jgi:Holliday junction DNA helicase RuvA|nr:Holliday junction branch migration protein RuvA [Dehalococcoidales bacterium]MDP7525060.1 Holliday junction branch migration protein RuvA [Dehalococcoidales bacterium]
MIASLHGKIESKGGDGAVINVNGVGFRVYMPTSTISLLGRTGDEAHLQTHMVMREDSVTLYGFSTTEELELFQILTTVSGLGPKLAIAVLSAMSVEQANMAIATGSSEMLVTISGIGKRMAERIIVELKDKVGAGLIASPAAQFAQENTDVIAALSSLGYSIAEASQAVATLPSSDLDLEEKVKLALQYFSSQ